MHVEFLGVPRERVGVSEVEIDADTLGQVLDVLVARFPRLADLLNSGELPPSVAVNLNCDAFVTDRNTPLAKDDRLLILSADAGG